jgi:hypothetical protein
MLDDLQGDNRKSPLLRSGMRFAVIALPDERELANLIAKAATTL